MVKFFKKTRTASDIPAGENAPDDVKSAGQNHRNDSVGLQVVLDLSPQLRINPVSIPEIKLPLERTDNTPDLEASTITYWPIKCERVHDEIAELVNSRRGIVLQSREIRRIQNILAGRAWKRSGLTAEGELILDVNPLVEGLYILLHQRTQQGQFEFTCTKLLAELRRLGHSKGVDIHSEQWPRGAAQLSRKLVEQKQNLAAVGIHFERGRRSGGERFISLRTFKKSFPDSKYVDDADDPASQSPSSNNPKNSKADSPFDAGDSVLAEELASINTSSKGEKR
ncbi:MAG: hypothetical protein KDA78_01905 [Planctomycetaceae bacterium]|nr:hypothetical protein [Planctomycetaceae bacterium]